mmetsp:Transcript_26176/g.56774  ORF Transcript_26176/g.56774 Transcript_26176/m.56774 type:complete len:220 (-) Transcript_26176:2025-2684(-)
MPRNGNITGTVQGNRREEVGAKAVPALRPEGFHLPAELLFQQRNRRNARLFHCHVVIPLQEVQVAQPESSLRRSPCHDHWVCLAGHVGAAELGVTSTRFTRERHPGMLGSSRNQEGRELVEVAVDGQKCWDDLRERWWSSWWNCRSGRLGIDGQDESLRRDRQRLCVPAPRFARVLDQVDVHRRGRYSLVLRQDHRAFDHVVKDGQTSKAGQAHLVTFS